MNLVEFRKAWAAVYHAVYNQPGESLEEVTLSAVEADLTKFEYVRILGDKTVRQILELRHELEWDDEKLSIAEAEIKRLRGALSEAANMSEHASDRTLIFNFCKQALDWDESLHEPETEP